MSSSLTSKWDEVCSRVSSYDDVDSSQFNALMERVQPQAMSDGFLLITADNSFLKTWIERNFLDSIKKALLDIYNLPFTVVVEIDDSGESANRQASGSSAPSEAPAVARSETLPQPVTPSPAPVPTMGVDEAAEPDRAISMADMPATAGISEAAAPQPALAPRQAPVNQTGAASTLTFENFVIGESNRMAYSMAVQVAEVPGKSALNPLFIYGKSGLGKTHLMRAIQNYINETRPELVTIYADSEELISGYTDAAAESNREKLSYKNFKTYYENADILLIDDIQFLQGKVGTLDIVFQIFNKLINQGKQIVLSADRAPKNIDIEERYTSRFVQGGTIDIQPPEVETKLAIVKSFINEYRMTQGDLDFNIPENIQMYIAENSGSNIRELKGAVTILVYHLNYSGQDTITVGEVASLLENHFSKGMSRNITIDNIQEVVQDYYKVKHSDLVGKSRSREVVFPRHVAIYLCRQLLDQPFNDIGKKFNRDHTTAMHSVSKVEEMLLKSRDVQEEIETLKKIINDL